MCKDSINRMKYQIYSDFSWMQHKKRDIPHGMSPQKTTKNLKSLFLLLVQTTVVNSGIQQSEVSTHLILVMQT